MAHEEPERFHHAYIGSEHLLLGVLREDEGLAAKVLNSLGVELATVRSAIESVLGRNQRVIIQQIVPTSRVKKVIEISFEEARRMGDNHVGTEHLLLGLLIEGEGIAAHVLEDLGANLEAVREQLSPMSVKGRAKSSTKVLVKAALHICHHTLAAASSARSSLERSG
jgi:ATP-dependent Clp protease ATP-binding subunit ClpC